MDIKINIEKMYNFTLIRSGRSRAVWQE